MSIELQSALVAAAVALVTSLLAAYGSFVQLQRERRKWMIDLKVSYSIELHRVRLATYPVVLEDIGRLSSRSDQTLSPSIAREVGAAINKWFYSSGGLCAEASTRGALLGLREACFDWTGATPPKDFYQWRNAAIFLLRRDIDVIGLEDFDAKNTMPLLNKLNHEMDSIEKKGAYHASWSEHVRMDSRHGSNRGQPPL